jgi:hypothetical protein
MMLRQFKGILLLIEIVASVIALESRPAKTGGL